MVKPSIFSNNYEKKMKKRKRRNILLVFLVALICIAVIFFMNKNTKKWISTNLHKGFSMDFINKSKKTKTENKQQETAKSEEKKKVEVDKEKENKANKVEEKTINVKISDTLDASANYTVENDKKKFKELVGGGSNINYNISPSGKLMVISDKVNSRLLTVDVDGNIVDCTKTQYVSTSGSTFNKDNVVKQFAGYNWCSNAKFIDDENFVYLSSLPWFDGRKTQYIWKFNINTKEHFYIQGIEGENIKFNELSADGLSITVDDKNFILDSSGAVKQQ